MRNLSMSGVRQRHLHIADMGRSREGSQAGDLFSDFHSISGPNLERIVKPAGPGVPPFQHWPFCLRHKGRMITETVRFQIRWQELPTLLFDKKSMDTRIPIHQPTLTCAGGGHTHTSLSHTHTHTRITHIHTDIYNIETDTNRSYRGGATSGSIGDTVGRPS